MVINLGARWMIGNGENISVWHDPRLKGRHDSLIRSLTVQGMEGLRVKGLWDGGRNWNNNFIDLLFILQEAKLTKTMPRFDCSEEDSLFW